jgi:transcriptional regulator with XRE-family HTH domain
LVYCDRVLKRKKRVLKRPRSRFNGPLIAQLRKKMGMTQEQLGAAVGLDKTAISHIERRQSGPGIMVLPALAAALDTTVDKLLEAA